ncbi:apical junction component 1 homolog [Hippocampus zosterae]|uniref:apical junction component 1 homolog n=1 Tax=Hippocampus zosterae TaxID=109293 RepID=UPI00223D18D1|nr:apical junction component 1 homolog [Hippocampus zosterae]
MTRTHPPDILTSTLYQDIPLYPTTDHVNSAHSSLQCDLKMIDKAEIINKRHCRSFDFLESLDDPQSVSSPMEYPFKRKEQQPEQQTLHKDLTWNGLDQPGYLRFSSPDLFNSRQTQQQTSQDKTSHLTWSDSVNRKRSRSAPRIKSTLTPVPISVSPLEANQTKDAPDTLRSSETQREAHSSNRVFLNEVHPIKLQPHSPLYVSDCFDEGKSAITPHVRCRVDIKPDAAVLQHTSRQVPNLRPDRLAWQRYSQASSSRGLYAPRQISPPTPTPSECYNGDFRQGYHYTTSMSPVSYQHLDMCRMPSQTAMYLNQEQRAYSNPNIPTKFFYTEDPVHYPVHPFSRTYFQDDRSSLASRGSTMTSQYDPRNRWVHTLPPRSYYTDNFSHQEPTHSVYSTPYPTSEAGSCFSQTPSSSYFGDDPRFNPYHQSCSNIYYNKPFSAQEERYFPSRQYHTEGRKRPRMSQAFSDDWYRSSLSGYSNQSSQLTPPRVSTDTCIPPWYSTYGTETGRLRTEAKNHSKSWDNILYPRHDREQSVLRGRSYENLFNQARHGRSPNVSSQPVILNLSSSPKRYAALSLSETSLERGSSNLWKNSKSGHWFVTPEITITDNDICAGNREQRGVHAVNWNTLDSEKKFAPRVIDVKKSFDTAEVTKERKRNNVSLQQSLEQLDELLADLVVDYKPPASRKPSGDFLDQLKQLITEDDEKVKGSSKIENLECLNTQLPSSKSSPDTIKDPDSGCDALQRSAEECSPDHSVEEEETLVCANKKCKRSENMFNACLYFKSCHSCYTFYCSRNCRRDDWESHKETCLYGRVSSVCRHTIKFCRENSEIHKAFSRIAKAGYLSRGRGVLFLGFANPETTENFLQVGLESLVMSPTYLSLRELDGFKDNLGDYCKELQQAGNEYDPRECFLLNVSVAVGELVPNRPSPRVQTPTVRKYAMVSLASSSPEKKLLKKDSEMETLILTPPPGTPAIDQEGEEGRKAREVCFVNIQRELRVRGVFLRHEYPKIYNQLCEFVESNKRFTPTTIYPLDKRTGKQFMCMIMAASEPRTLDWVDTPHLLDDII